MTHHLLAARRGWFLSLLCTVALAAALATVSVGPDHDASATEPGHTHSATSGHLTSAHAVSTSTPADRTAQSAFHDQMRKLWEDHVTWTRLAIVTFADGSSGFDATAARLLANQVDIGDAIKPFYGDAAGDQLTTLLNGHIGIAVELLQAAKTGDSAAFEEARVRWYANSDEIADFLAAANPKYWPQDTMRTAMTAHLDQTLAEAAHELNGQYAASVADYDEIHHHILEMADLLSNGIIRTFPKRFSSR
ncbi:hypothetical protein ISU10_00700 [Nocardioides agariphilus]|jgi:hypothetical protein|uniref:Glycosyltransferase n=1 Tax=Nocardioides agariphilus TaxID=433664 RepID=A0A930VKG8_9ACTN|nr:hypothetical protein [Nocardioides agariphilus]MBF4766281.1 hypothetical protein [Nocardioides agariphilus]